MLAILALPAANVPKANAFHANNSFRANLSGILVGAVDPLFGSVTAAQASSTVTVSIVIQASGFTPSYQRNVTFGFKGDWMSQYQNASSATTPLQSNAIGSATISVTMPAAGGPGSLAHTWTVAVWDGPANAMNPVACPSGDAEKANACLTTSGSPITIYTSDQYTALQARSQEKLAISHVGSTGFTAAQGQLDQANIESDLGDQSWANGDYGGAKTHYQNALSDANAAAATFVNQAGGATNAAIVQAILSGTGTALFGIGGLLAGIGGFFYLRRKPKA